MSHHTSLVALVLAAILVPCLPARAAMPEEEAQFTAAAQKAFDARKPTALSDLTCWDDASEKSKKASEKVYQLLLDEKGVTFTVTLEPLGEKAFDKQLVQDGEPCRWNLKPV